MGKKKKKFAGSDTAYDYLKKKFDNQYMSNNEDRVSSGVYNAKKEEAFQRYLYTGEKTTGSFGGDIAMKNKDKDKKPDKAERLFEAGIPVQQWDYYKDKSGTNANSKSDIKDIIKTYNADERYQGPGEEKEKKNEIDGTAGLEYYDNPATPEEGELTEVEEAGERLENFQNRMAPEYFGIDGRAGLRFSQTRPEQDKAKAFRDEFRDKLKMGLNNYKQSSWISVVSQSPVYDWVF